MEVAEDAPFTESKSIVFPGLFLSRAQLSSYILAHDIYIDDGRTFPVPDPVLERAYAKSTVLKWLRTVSLNPRSSPLFLSLLNFLTCYDRDQRCAAQQNVTLSAALTFYLAHEYGHIAAGDVGEHEYQYSLSKELAADAFASRALRAFSEDRYPDNANRDATLLSPVGVLLLHAATLPEGSARSDIDQRITALLNLLPKDTQRRYQDIAVASDKPTGLSSVTLTWDGSPEWVAIDGLSYSPADLQGKALRLTTDSHQIVSVGPDGVAYYFLVLTGGSAKVHLRYQPFSSRLPDQDELARMREEYDLGDIIRQTATPELRPRNPSVAFALFEALRRCKLGLLIDPDNLPLDAPAVQRRTVERWSREGKPFSAWRP
jgi:hypothetical protein